MGQKEWMADINGHQVRVANSWSGGTTLYIDGDRRDSNRGLSAVKWTRWLSARSVPNDPKSDLIEIYVKAIFRVKVQIYVNGQRRAGDEA